MRSILYTACHALCAATNSTNTSHLQVRIQ